MCVCVCVCVYNLRIKAGFQFQSASPKYCNIMDPGADFCCMCEDLDLYDEVHHDTELCKRCDKRVLILNLERYKSSPCTCGPESVYNQWYFCEICRGLVRKPDMSPHKATVIAVQRACFIARRVLDIGRDIVYRFP